MFLLVSVAAALTGIGVVFALPVLAWGFCRFGLHMYDGGARLKDVFSGFSRYGRALTGMLACLIGIMLISIAGQSVQLVGQLGDNTPVFAVGYVINLAVSLLILPRLTFAYLLVVDQDMGGFDALRRSWESTRPCKWKVVGLSVLTGLVMLAGMLVLIVGVVPAMVIAWMAWVSSYRQLFGRPAAA